jgi:hypothetical protein
MTMRSLPVALLALGLAAAPAAAQQEPPRRLDLSRETAEHDAPPQDAARTAGHVRDAFVRDQTILGLAMYGPAFAAMVGHNGITAVAGYLVMAGGSFFAAAEVTRRMEMSEAQQLLATRMAWRSGLGALHVVTAPDSPDNANTAGAATLLGGLLGTGLGLAIGNGLTPGEAIATTFGHDLLFLAGTALAVAADPDRADSGGLNDQSRAIIGTASGWAGYALGRFYAGNVPYNVTAGDVTALWLGAAIGATATGALIAESDPGDRSIALTSLAGALLGTYAADRVLVRRYDHSRGEGNLLALGGAAGGLMGIGVGVLVAGEIDRGGSLTLGLAAAGAATGALLTERYLRPRRDAGRTLRVGGVSVHPVGLASLASGLPGRHTLLRLTF